MKVLVVGSGAREHALAWKLAGERGVAEVVCAPGNPGMAAVARCIAVDVGDPAALLQARRSRADLSHPDRSRAAAQPRRGRCIRRRARFRSEPHVGLVLASSGYPESSDSGRIIGGLNAAAQVPGALVFHAGTARRDGQIVTAGGRVLTVVGRGRTYRGAIDIAYRAAGEVALDGMQLRTDIGKKALEHAR